MKDVYVINNKTYHLEGIVDEYASFIWTDRYNEYGDFELYIPATEKYLELFKLDYYLWIESSEHQMVVESIKLSSSVDEGNMMTITGRSLESLLLRRVIWDHITYSGSIQNQVQNLLNKCFISPSIANRRVPNFVFKASTDPNVTKATYNDDADMFGEELYDVITKMCSDARLGFRIVKTDDNKLEFSLYNGVNRSYDQQENPHVILSPAFDNIISSDYEQDSEDYKNYILVAGSKLAEAETKEVIVTAGNESVSGLDRRETYINASDIQSDKVPDFSAALRTRGTKELENYKIRNDYDGEISSDITYTYQKDYFIGDIVQLENIMGVRTKVQIMGFTISVDTGGSSSYPELEFIDNDE